MKKEELIDFLNWYEPELNNCNEDSKRIATQYFEKKYLKSSDCKDKTPKVITNEDNGNVCVLCGIKLISNLKDDNCCDKCWLELT